MTRAFFRAHYSPDQPRDSGKFAEVEGSSGSESSKADTAGGDAKSGVEWKQEVDANGRPIPIHANTTDEAVTLILAGKVVELDDVEAVHTVLSQLGKIANEAKERGEKAPNYDLCQVSVPGTNLFCSENIGRARVDMPQFKTVPVPGSEADKLPRNKDGEVDGTEAFVAHLESIGVPVGKAEGYPANKLRAAQRELIGSKVAGMMTNATYDPTKAELFITRDNYIVDGHHRWAATVGRDAADGHLGDLKMNIRRIDAPVSEVMPLAVAWGEKFGLRTKRGSLRARMERFMRERAGEHLVAAYSPDQPRDKGQFAVVDGGGGSKDNWSTDRAAEKTVRDITSRVRATPGDGFTFRWQGNEQAKEGFALSLHKDREMVIDAKDFSPFDVCYFVADNADLLAEEGNYIGAWHNPDDGKVYLDVSTIVADRGEAMRLGRANNQLAIYDLGGPGRDGEVVAVEKEESHGTREKRAARKGISDNLRRYGAGSRSADGRRSRQAVERDHGAVPDQGRVGEDAGHPRRKGDPMSLSMRMIHRVLTAIGVGSRGAAGAPEGESDTDIRRAVDAALRAASISGYLGIEALYVDDGIVIYSAMPDTTMMWFQASYERDPSGVVTIDGDVQRVEPKMRYEPADIDEEYVEVDEESVPDETAEPKPDAEAEPAVPPAAKPAVPPAAAAPPPPADPKKKPRAASCGCGCSPQGDGHDAQSQRGERNMAEIRDLVDRLIGCHRSPFAETDRRALEAFGKSRLAELVGKLDEVPDAPPPQEEFTEEQWIARAPAALSAIVTKHRADEEAARKELISALTKEQKEFGVEQLTSKPTDELKALARLIKLVDKPVRDFSGLGAVGIAPDAVNDYTPPDGYGLNKREAN